MLVTLVSFLVLNRYFTLMYFIAALHSASINTAWLMKRSCYWIDIHQIFKPKGKRFRAIYVIEMVMIQAMVKYLW